MCKGSNTTTTTSGPPPEVMDAYRALLSRAQGVADTPYQAYTGQQVAGFTPDQLRAFQSVRDAQGVSQPYINTAAGYAAQSALPSVISNDTLQPYLNPYQKQVTDATIANINETNAQQQQQVVGNAIKNGAWGGDRAGVAQAELARQQALASNQTLAGLNSQNYTQAVQNKLATDQANSGRAGQAAFTYGALGQQAQNAGLQDASALLSMGGLQQQLGQAQLNVPYQQFLEQRAYPFQTTQFLAGITGALGSQMGGTSQTTGPAPSPWSSLFGAGLAGLSFFSDERMKEDVEKVGELYDGQPVYRYRYKGEPATRIGLMAQDVEHRHPEAVGEAGGYKTVDYAAATDDAAGRRHFAGGGIALPYSSTEYVPLVPIAPGASTIPRGGATVQQPQQDALGVFKLGKDALALGKELRQGMDKFGSSVGDMSIGSGGVDILSGLGALYARGGMVEPQPGGIHLPRGYVGGGVVGLVPNDEDISIANPDIPVAGRALLNTIAGSESPDYDVMYGGRRFADFSDHPRVANPITTGPNAGQTSSAAGRYQFLAPTWDKTSAALGMKEFTPENQDTAAWYRAQVDYSKKTGRNLESDILEADGDPAKLNAIGGQLGGTWTSLPGGIEPNGATGSFGSRMAAELRGEGADGPVATQGAPRMAFAPEGGVAGPPLATAPAAVPEVVEKGDGRWGLGHLPRDVQMALLSAGLGMMASRSPFLANAIGEGGLAGLSAYGDQQKAALTAKKEEREALTQKERTGLETRRVELQAQSLAQAAQRAAEDLKLRTRGQEFDQQKFGYRMKPDGTFEFIPGGPADPATVRRLTGAKETGGEDIPEGFRKKADGSYEPIPGGAADPAYLAQVAKAKGEGKGGKPLSSKDRTDFEKSGSNLYELNGLAGTFDDAYGGWKSSAVGDIANMAARNLGLGNKEAADWWQRYQMMVNPMRHQLFGSALTKTEAREWEKAAISPGMTPEAIRTNLERQRSAALRAAKKIAGVKLAEGTSPEVIEAAIGMPLAELGLTPKTAGNGAPSASTAAPAATPQRPATVPEGSMYSPSRKMWRSPDGKMFDANGNPV